MRLLLSGVSFVFLICVFECAFGISISSDEWTSTRRHVHRLTKRQTSASSSSASVSSEEDPESALEDELWYDKQCKDHTQDCSSKNNQWSQRYWMSMKHYQPGGPIFMLLGGESPTSQLIHGGAWKHYAKFYNACTIAVEHRYYGQSFPTPQSDRTPEAMRILTSRQALHDYARIIKWFKNENDQLKDAKVVTIGGSYPGFLSAWFRALYPDVVNVALASSAPLNYTFEFPEMFRTTSKVILSQNPECFNRLKSTFTCIEGILNGTGCSSRRTNSTIDTIMSDTNYCGPLDTDIDKENFINGLGSSIWVQNEPGTKDLLPAKNLTMSLCDILLDQSKRDIVKRYGKFIKKSYKTTCQRRKKRQSPMNDSGGYTYSWNWQSCNEFVNLQVADNTLGMLGTNYGIKSGIDYCNYYYPTGGFDEKKLRENVARTTEQYPPGKGYNGTCTIFVNGSWDPWGTKGITKKEDTSDKNSVYYITNGEHTDDLDYPNSNPFASSSIIRTQKRVMRKIGIYLNSNNC